ncbi:hypothetical protein FGU65_05560 [Methanoculleus sp. FWC-SCC1]|uniref:Yip1 domain-containing protein n=1 Tax=Methanoculleus frigidifontis TaxID=2584085 RepID=A0ABT8M8V3_9EURY|nr:small multi-drug export protein [Methanoculleus sp. FWC-SCC1]MDN7024362.1 hypothetical protein [Methanoculleus sp. FWC-SCC1]
MNLSGAVIWLRQAAEALAFIMVLSVLLPLLFGSAAGIPAGRVLTLVGSTVILQANGAFTGAGLGMEPWEILVIMTLVALGAVLGIFAICDTFALTSKRVRTFLEKAEKSMQKFPWVSKYGAVSLIVLPALPVIGLYASVVIAWILRWNRFESVLFITIGWIGAVIFVLLLAFGFISLVF